MHQILIEKIKDKPPLDRLDNGFVLHFINEFFKRSNTLKIKCENETLKEREIKKIVKEVRNELNKIYGQFWKVKKVKLNLNYDIHQSTFERKEFYHSLYEKLFSITGKPKTVLDIGAGLNPLSYGLIGNDVFYYVNELTKEDCNLIEEYLKKNKFKFEILQGDVLEIKEFPEVDVCFLFKILDSLDLRDHKTSENLINKIKANYLIVSFASVTTKNRGMNYPRRGWFEQMLKRLGYKFNKLEFVNEIFYVIKK